MKCQNNNLPLKRLSLEAADVQSTGHEHFSELVG
jgi:hypothetical protein